MTDAIPGDWMKSEPDYTFTCSPHLATRRHVRRGWERAPCSPFAARLKGKKVWKRSRGHAASGNAPCNNDIEPRFESGRSSSARPILQQLDSNVSHAVKKIRLKDHETLSYIGQDENDPGVSIAARFRTTRGDDHPGTPRRKPVTTLSTPVHRGNVKTLSQAVQATTSTSETASQEITPHKSDPGKEEYSSPLRPLQEDNTDDQCTYTSPRPILTTERNGDIGTADETTTISSGGASLPQASPSELFTSSAPDLVSAELASCDTGGGPKTESEAGMPQMVNQIISSPREDDNQGPSLSDDKIIPPDSVEEMKGLSSLATDSCLDTDPKENCASCSSKDVTEVGHAMPSIQTPRRSSRTRTRQFSNNSTAVVPISSSRSASKAISSVPLLSSPEAVSLDSPQIGTTLLRRASLRQRQSLPNYKQSTSTFRSSSKSPRKRMKKRDTLQEREILQKFTAESGLEERLSLENQLSPSVALLNHSPKGSMTPDFSVAHDENLTNEVSSPVAHYKPVSIATTPQPNQDASSSAQCSPTTNMQLSIDTQSASTASLEQGDDFQAASDIVALDQTEKAESAKACLHSYEKEDDGDEGDVRQEIGLATGGATDTSSHNSYVRQTRSGARLSDDTTVLHDFLHRIQAKKAAANHNLQVPASLQVSPRKSPCKGSSQDTSSLARSASPRKSAQEHIVSSLRQDESTIPCTKDRGSDATDGTNQAPTGSIVNVTAEVESTLSQSAAPCRRSNRTRLPTPCSNGQSVPSLIPVRRANEPVVLHKSEAQELAMTTRTNTRRNQGSAKSRSITLQAVLASQEQCPSPLIAKPRLASNPLQQIKVVSWAQDLVEYQDDKLDVMDTQSTSPRSKIALRSETMNSNETAHFDETMSTETSEPRPRARRIKALGAVNVTPAKKKVAKSTSTGARPNAVSTLPAPTYNKTTVPKTNIAVKSKGQPALRRRAR